LARYSLSATAIMQARAGKRKGAQGGQAGKQMTQGGHCTSAGPQNSAHSDWPLSRVHAQSGAFRAAARCQGATSHCGIIYCRTGKEPFVNLMHET